MATWADIQSWDHGYVIEAEDLIEQELREARELVSDIEHAAHDIRSQGKGPDQMRQRLSEIQALLDARINELSEYAMATAALHGYVSRVVAMRKSAWEVAAEIDCEISESGEVILGPDSGGDDGNRTSKYHELCDIVSQVVAIATEAEATVGPRYKALADGQYVMPEGRHSESAGLKNDADPSWSPEEVSVWWGLLSESEREALINKDPQKYGNLNGIDMESRAKANDIALFGRKDAAGNRIPGSSLIEQTEKELKEAEEAIAEAGRAGTGNPTGLAALIKQRDDLRNRLKDLEAIRGQLESNAGATLVTLELGARGENVRAAIAIGDVDNAEHVTTMVPGMTTTCRDNARLNVEYAKNLQEAAELYGGAKKGSVAAIAWLGYEAPSDPRETLDLSVASTHKAEVGGQRLNGFLTGIHSWRAERGMDVHQSAITHSYGSTTGGFAMRDISEGVVDDFVYTGSPGSAVQSVGTLGVDPEHTWVSATPLHDAVQGMGTDWNFGRDPKELEGIGHLSGDTSGGEGYNADPNADTNANHSSYFKKALPDKRNRALEDIGKVIADSMGKQ